MFHLRLITIIVLIVTQPVLLLYCAMMALEVPYNPQKSHNTAAYSYRQYGDFIDVAQAAN